MKIGACITSFGAIDPVVYRNHLSVLLDWKKRFDLEVYQISDTQQEAALNALTRSALSDNCDYLFYMEHDNIYHKDTLDRLLSHDVAMVSGYYTFRNWPFAPIPLKLADNGLVGRFEYLDDPTDPDAPSLFEITVGCLGCTLVSAELMAWLFNVKDFTFRREYDKKSNSTLTPDCVLYNDLQKYGVKHYVDGKTRIGHLGSRLVITPDNYRLYREMLQVVQPELVNVVDRNSEERSTQVINCLLENTNEKL